MVNLGKQKELAARALGVSKKRIKFSTKTEHKKDLKEVISREGVKELVSEKIIVKKAAKGNSRTRANHILSQKKKGRRQGQGSRKGTENARFKSKDKWIIKIRSLRKVLKNLKDSDMLDTKTNRDLYRKAKGNFFRNKKHLMLYINQNELLGKVQSKGGKN